MDFISPELNEYIESHTASEPEVLRLLNRETNAKAAGAPAIFLIAFDRSATRFTPFRGRDKSKTKPPRHSLEARVAGAE